MATFGAQPEARTGRVWRPLKRKLPRYYPKAQHVASVIVGDCLRPWLLPGDIVWSDPTLEPEDGDVVLVSMLYRRANFIGAGGTMRRDAVKQLRIRDGVSWLDSHDGCTADPRHEIIGPVVMYYRGWRFRPALRDMRFNFRPIGGRAASDSGSPRSTATSVWGIPANRQEPRTG
jgi:hypothetical protein